MRRICRTGSKDDDCFHDLVQGQRIRIEIMVVLCICFGWWSGSGSGFATMIRIVDLHLYGDMDLHLGGLQGRCWNCLPEMEQWSKGIFPTMIIILIPITIMNLLLLFVIIIMLTCHLDHWITNHTASYAINQCHHQRDMLSALSSRILVGMLVTPLPKRNKTGCCCSTAKIFGTTPERCLVQHFDNVYYTSAKGL